MILLILHSWLLPTVALSKSEKDGDKKGHPAAIGKIRAKANQIWNKDITKI